MKIFKEVVETIYDGFRSTEKMINSIYPFLRNKLPENYIYNKSGIRGYLS